MSREITGLKWARLSKPPGWLREKRRKGSRALGIRYERKLAELLASRFALSHGQWFEFEDASRQSWCQPDIILHYEREDAAKSFGPVVLECKLMRVENALKQLRGLYLPVVERALRPIVPPRGIVVVKSLSHASDESPICASLDEAIERASSGEVPTWHWLGTNFLG